MSAQQHSVPSANVKRLYVGNLDPTIDEYAVVKLFEPFGKITYLDFMFHWHGTKRGQPRGYCFLEYSTKEEALKAIETMHQKTVKGRPLVVSFAHAAPVEEDSRPNGKRGQTAVNTLNRPNAFTILKTQKMANASTDAKIQALEKKLAQLKEQRSESPSPSSASSSPAPSSPSGGRGGPGLGRMNGSARGEGHRGGRGSRHKPY
ncbi:hypothetical protein BC938DRAFT_479114 [Jimgerdemannia flammicorona]|nr:hypothetical protein BC938DRAFT_479114 [Jimgerdemannia flammicorona]